MFEQYYATHKRKIDALARRYSRSCLSLHDDYVSVLTERLWRCYGRGHEADGLIYVALKHAAIDFYRSRQAKHAEMSSELKDDIMTSNSVEDNAIDRVMVAQLISRCKNKSAQAMVLAYYRGDTYAEIAAENGVHHNVVRRAIQRLAS